MIKDRGNKKWTSLMLVDHKRKLKDFKKSKNDREKPKLDEQKLEEMDYLLEKAAAKNKKICIKYYHNKNYHYYQGKVKKINKNTLLFKSKKKYYQLNLDNIIDINIID